MKKLFTISWSDIPNTCVANLVDACGYYSATLMQNADMDALIRKNINIELEKFHASEFADNPWTEPIYYWDNLDFEDESYYTWFLLRWS